MTASSALRMSLPKTSHFCRSLARVTTAAFILLGFGAPADAIDLNGNGLSDTWELMYPSATNPNADSNNDGKTNLAESIFGTNPLLPGGQSVNPTISYNKVTNTLQVSWPSVLGKVYQLQSRADLSSGNWGNDGVPMDGTGGTLSVGRAVGSVKYFCVRVSDKDTNSDGLTDWESLAMGMDPTKLDSNGDGVSDKDYVTEQLALPNVVIIKATDPYGSEDGPKPATLTVSRGVSLLPITVNYSIGGSATAGVDYAPLSGSVNFAAGQKVASISVNPTVSPAVKGSRSVTATLSPSPAYDLGTPSSATAILYDSTVASGTGLLARYYDHANTVYAHAANFGDAANYAFTRGAPTTTGSIVVTPTTGNVGAMLAALQVGNLVKLSFNGGNLNSALYNHADYTVTAKTATNFTVSITAAAALPTNSSSTCNFSIQSFPHPAVIERVDPTVDSNWLYGTPNGVVIAPNNSPDNYSAIWEGYLQPTTAGSYRFQLDADDKARVLVDLDRNGVLDDPAEQVVEHGWTSTGTVGTFKVSSAFTLAVPTTATGTSGRYKIRVEHVETTGDARCRLQWSLNGGTFANIPQANQFTHTQTLTYSFARLTTATGTATITTANTFAGGETVNLAFSTGNLFVAPGYSGSFTVKSAPAPTATAFAIDVAGASLPTSGTGSGYLENSASATIGLLNRCYANTTFTGPPGRVGVDGNGNNGAVTVQNNGIWGAGTPDVALIQPDTFSIRWSGQVQPQFTEDYTFIVGADDGCSLWINGQQQALSTLPSASTAGSTYTYDAATGNAVINYASLIVPAGSYAVGETVRLDPSSGNLTHAGGSSYTYDDATGDIVVNYSNLTNVTPGGFVVGEMVELDPTSGSLGALALLPYAITAATSNTFTVNAGPLSFNPYVAIASVGTGSPCTVTTVQNHGLATGAQVKIASVSGGAFAPAINGVQTVTVTGPTTFTVASDCTVAPAPTTGTLIGLAGNITVSDNRNAVITAVTPTTFTVNFGVGKYANGSTGNVSLDIVNKPLKEWASTANERFVRIPMIGGVRYDIRLDYYENTNSARAQLYWYSASQPRQVIPSSRLYPSDGPLAPAVHVSPTEAAAVVNGPFSYQVKGTNGANVSVSGLPDGLSYDQGVISGTPTSAGEYQILITVTNSTGTSTSVLNLKVEATGGAIGREFWNEVTGTNVSDIPLGIPATGTTSLTSLEGPTNSAEDYGARIRGYITPPVTGNYYFWIAANNAAELWISNDDEPVTAHKRAWVTSGNGAPQQWNDSPSQKSPWLALEAGKRYYVEILHKAGVGADNLAVGWLKPGEAGTAPSEVVPGYALSPYVEPPLSEAPGTLYVATMLAQEGANTRAVGTATMRLSADENTAIVNFTYSGLTGEGQNGFNLTGLTDWHVHVDPYLGFPSAIVYDGVEPVNPNDGPQSDGSHHWTIETVGPLSKATIIEIIKQGKSYINLHTAMYPNGEIRGNYTLANGSRAFTPPPAPPAWTDDHTNNNAAARFLAQATFGPNPADIAALKAMPSYEAWINDQFTKPASHTLAEVVRTETASAQGGAFDETLVFNAWWRNSVSGDDQLRQRIAFALSEIHVVSAQGPLDNNARALAFFYDMLADHAFGNFRDLLEETTLTWSMGRYLDMFRNDKPDLSVGRIPNENYAREIKQLFSVGLFDVWPDGTLKLNSKDELIPTYTQREIVGFAHVFTGWDYGYDGPFRTSFSAPANVARNMREVPARHFTGPKRVLNNEVLPGLPTLGGAPLDPYATHSTGHFNNTAYQNLPAQELDAVHDQLFNHPNVGPFICRQLIQRLVTSHPSRDYLYRVVQKFNDNGSGVRGDMKAVIKAILLDYEARSSAETTKPAYGKQREPVLRVAAAGRAFRVTPFSGTYVQTGSGGRTITINTTTPHRLASGNNVFLDFTTATGGPAPWIGSYGVTVTSANQFTVTAQGWATGTYSQTAGSNVMTITMGGHWLPAGGQAYFDFTSGTANGLVGFDNTVRTAVTSTSTDTASGTTFTITALDTTARSGNVMIPRFSPGSFTTVASGLAAPNDRRVTMDTNFDHHLKVGDQVQVVFFTGANPIPTDMVVTVESVVDLNTYTFLATANGTNLGTNQGNNSVYQFPLLSQPLNRSGSVSSRAGTFAMGNTDGVIDQTPLNSPTVFNFYLPDYKFPGALASQGITTPEFQETAETSVIRQANFLERGVYASGNTNGLSSFRDGNNSIVMDLAQWFGNATGVSGPGQILGAGPQTGQAWTSNANLATLVDRLSTLLMGRLLPPNAKTEITNFVSNAANISYNNTTPSDTNKRDRLRAILHFILTSPDFTIQR